MTPKHTKIGPFARTMLICLTLGLMTGCHERDNDSNTVSLVILQTSDVHHHASGYGPQTDYTPLNTTDNDSVMGGYARLSGMIKRIRKDAFTDKKPVLLLDSGDFLMGTIYDLTASDPIAFKFLESMEYDAVTLGNHEFDWGGKRLGDLIEAGMQSGFDVPIVATNMKTDPLDSGDDAIEGLVAKGTIVESKIITTADDIKVGILGYMGMDADSVAPAAAPVSFDHDYAFLQSKVDALKSSGADLIVLLSHTGILEDGSGEDSDIAENVTGIDIIASGHMHTATTTEFTKGVSNTIIFSPGEYGAYLSRLDITYDKAQKKIIDHTFKLLLVDDTVPGDKNMDKIVKRSQSLINTELSAIGISADTLVSKTTFDLQKQPLQETGFGDLVADAIRKAASDLDAVDREPYTLSAIASGVIRDNIYQGKTGNITFSDVYNALPLGISPYGDTAPGYPLMSIYVTAAEIRNICEISASAAPLMGENYYVNLSGIRYGYRLSNMFLSRVTDVFLCDTPNTDTAMCVTELDLEDKTTLYRLAINYYALSMLKVTTSLNLPIIPKHKNGDPVLPDDFKRMRIDASADNDGVQELKEWMAFEHFLERYYPPTGEGIPAAVYGNKGTALGRATVITTE